MVQCRLGLIRLAPVLLLTACAVTPPPPPSVNVPADWRSALPGQVRVESQWWQVIQDPQLSALLDLAESQNFNVAAANHRVEQARVALASIRGQQWPSVDWSASTAHSAGSTSKTAGIGGAYQLDLWGEVRARNQAAQARLVGVQASREVTIWRLRIEVAQAYYQRRALAERLVLAREALDIAEQTFARVQARYDAGIISGLDLALVRTAVAQERTNVSSIQLAEDLARDTMAQLLGRAPAEFVEDRRDTPPLLDSPLPPLPEAMPAEVLARRPDIRVLEAQMRAADANIAVARAQLFPSINISTAGSLALGGGEWVFSEGASLAHAIFDGGQRRATNQLAQLQRQELVENYRAGILASLVEIESAWVQVERLSQREALDRAVLESAERAYRLSETSYQSGLTDALTLLSSQRSFLTARDQLIQTRSAQFEALVALHAGLAP